MGEEKEEEKGDKARTDGLRAEEAEGGPCSALQLRPLLSLVLTRTRADRRVYAYACSLVSPCGWA